MAKPKKYKPCYVRDGRFVEPCVSLASVVGNAVSHQHFTNMTTGKPSRSFFVLKSGDHKQKGIVMNCCPFCGVRIDAPVNAETEPAT
jgi:hypothetical protein